MISVGTKVRVIAKTRGGSDTTYAGRRGVVVEFNPALPWIGARALLAPEQFVCVHFEPRTKLEAKRGSPMALFMEESLKVVTDENRKG